MVKSVVRALACRARITGRRADGQSGGDGCSGGESIYGRLNFNNAVRQYSLYASSGSVHTTGCESAQAWIDHGI